MASRESQRDNALTYFNEARRSLGLATSIDKVMGIRDKAEALRLCSKQAGENLEMQGMIAEIKIR